MRLQLSVVTAIVVGLLAGCSSTEPSTDTVTAAADHNAYTAPGTVVVTLINASDKSVFAGPCTGLQRYDGSGWADVPLNEVCPAVLREIRGGDTLVTTVGIPAEATPGQYRAIVGVTDFVVQFVIPTQTLTVTSR